MHDDQPVRKGSRSSTTTSLTPRDRVIDGYLDDPDTRAAVEVGDFGCGSVAYSPLDGLAVGDPRFGSVTPTVRHPGLEKLLQNAADGATQLLEDGTAPAARDFQGGARSPCPTPRSPLRSRSEVW